MEVFLIMINIVLFSSDNIVLENRKEVEKIKSLTCSFFTGSCFKLESLNQQKIQFQISQRADWERICPNETESDNGGLGGVEKAL